MRGCMVSSCMRKNPLSLVVPSAVFSMLVGWDLLISIDEAWLPGSAKASIKSNRLWK